MREKILKFWQEVNEYNKEMYDKCSEIENIIYQFQQKEIQEVKYWRIKDTPYEDSYEGYFHKSFLEYLGVEGKSWGIIRSYKLIGDRRVVIDLETIAIKDWDPDFGDIDIILNINIDEVLQKARILTAEIVGTWREEYNKVRELAKAFEKSKQQEKELAEFYRLKEKLNL